MIIVAVISIASVILIIFVIRSAIKPFDNRLDGRRKPSVRKTLDRGK